MANRFWVGGTAAWDGTAGSKWATTSGGAGGAAVPTSADAVFFDGNSGANTVTVSAGNTGCASIDCTGFTGTFAGTASLTVSGSVTIASGMTFSYSGDMTFDASATVTSNGKTFNGNVTLNAAGGTLTLGDAFTVTAAKVFTLSQGTWNLNGKATSIGAYGGSNTNTRAITSGGATLTVTGNNQTIWSGNQGSGFTLNDALQVDCTYSGAVGTRSISHGTVNPSEANTPSFKVSAGTDTVDNASNGKFKNLDFTGFSGTWSNNLRTIYGSLTISSGMTLSSGTNATTFAATSGTKTISSNGKTMDFPVTLDGVGGTWLLSDAMTVGSSRTTTLTNGTLDMNGNTLNTGRFSTANSNARTIKSTAAGGKIATSDTTAATVFDASTSTNLTVTRNSWTIEIGGNTANVRTFAGGGVTWPTLTFTNTTSNGELDITGSNTFKSLSVSTPPQAVKFTAGTTTTIEDNDGFPSGSGANLVTIGSITAASHTLTKSGLGRVSVDKLSISRSTATPDNTWYAGTGSTDGGNNTGWNFSLAPSIGFMTFFYP